MACRNSYNVQSNPLTNKTCGGCSRNNFNGRNSQKGMPFKNHQIVIDLGNSNVFNPCVTGSNRASNGGQHVNNNCGQSQSHNAGGGGEVNVACGNSLNNVDENNDLSVGNDFKCSCQCECDRTMIGGPDQKGMSNAKNQSCDKPFHCDCGECRHCREYDYVKTISKLKEAPARLSNKKKTFGIQPLRPPKKNAKRVNHAKCCAMEGGRMIDGECVIGGPLITEYRDKYRFYPDPQKWVAARTRRAEMNFKTFGATGKPTKLQGYLEGRPDWNFSLRLVPPPYEPVLDAAEAKLKVLDELIHGLPIKAVKKSTKSTTKSNEMSSVSTVKFKKMSPVESADESPLYSEDESDVKSKTEGKAKNVIAPPFRGKS